MKGMSGRERTAQTKNREKKEQFMSIMGASAGRGEKGGAKKIETWGGKRVGTDESIRILRRSTKPLGKGRKTTGSQKKKNHNQNIAEGVGSGVAFGRAKNVGGGERRERTSALKNNLGNPVGADT